MIGVVLSLVLVWGVVRLFTSEPAEIIQSPAPVLNGSAGVDSGYAAAPQQPAPASGPVAEPVAVQLTAAQADEGDRARRRGRIVFSGEMVIGERKRLDVTPPVHVRTGNGGALEIIVDGKDKGPLGEAPHRRTFRLT